jgi:hypothetical protein
MSTSRQTESTPGTFRRFHYRKSGIAALPAATRRLPRIPTLLVVLIVLATSLVTHPPTAFAATFEVTNCDDNGEGSLRAAITAANAHASVPHVITFSADLDCDLITLTTGQLTLERNMTIQGPGADKLAVSGDQETRVFRVDAGVTATISGLTITKGLVEDDWGGAVYNLGTLTIDESVISDSVSAGGYVNGSGSGIFNAKDATLIVRNSDIVNNSTIWGLGAGIGNFGTATIEDSLIDRNVNLPLLALSGAGAGIFNGDTGSLEITRSTISRNRLIPGTEQGGLGPGGGITNLGELTVTDSTISDNSARAGGGVTNGGTATIISSTISGNSAALGGGIFNRGKLTVTVSTIRGNNSTSFGGGINNESGTLTLTNSTLSGNSAINIGGGIANGSTLAVSSSTVSNNSVTNPEGSGGGIANYDGMLTLTSSIVAGNVAPFGPDVASTVAAASNYNLIGNGADMSGITDGSNDNQVGTADNPIDPLLGPLQDNDGPTWTHALLPGSPAIDTGGTECPETDQRGVIRPQGSGCDIGAFEQVDLAPTDVSIAINADATWTNDPAVSLTLSAEDDLGITSYRLAESEDGLDTADDVAVDPSEASFSVTVDFTLSDGDNASREVWFRACDIHGQCTDDSSTIGLDTTPPVITASASTPDINPYTGQWTNQVVTVVFTCADSGSVQSGIGTNDVADAAVSSQGENQSVASSGDCIDTAGNSAEHITFGNINIDLTLPVISGQRTPDANVNGWNNTDVVISFTCDDPLSGIGTNTVQGATLSSEGANQQVTNTGTCVDIAGNAAVPATVSGINIDKTAPVVNVPGDMTVVSPDGNGVVVDYATDVSVDEDASGASEPICVRASGSVFPLGVTSVACSSTDGAGNEGSAGFTITVVRDMVQACLFAGSLSQVSALAYGADTTVSCGRGMPVVLAQGADYYGCLFAGSLSQVGYSEPANCGRGTPISLAAGTDLHACLFAGSLSQVGYTEPSSCGRGTLIGFARADRP